jgi:hypothetical protein
LAAAPQLPAPTIDQTRSHVVLTRYVAHHCAGSKRRRDDRPLLLAAPPAPTLTRNVRAHTIQGTFCDPYYGGNANFVGWDLIGYPGIRMTVSEDEQRMTPKPGAIRESAYDSAMFTMKGGSHGH